MDNIAPVEWKPEQAVPRGPSASADDVKSALKAFAISEGFAVVVKNSYHNCVVLASSQEGSKRSHKAGGTTASEGLRTQRTEKVGCLYGLIIKANGSGSWVVGVVQDTHTMHLKLSGSTIGPLPSAHRHLRQQHDVETSIGEGYDAGIEVSKLWENLRVKSPWLALKDVVNSIQKLRVAQLGSMTEMEALHAKLKREQVLSSSLRDGNNRLTRLFFSPSSSQSLISRNCHVLLVDCTYQSNKHKMPLLHVVGAAGTHDMFTIARCFMENELEETYKWTLTALERCLSRQPGIVVVDHEKALINAIQPLWPTTQINLCR